MLTSLADDLEYWKERVESIVWPFAHAYEHFFANKTFIFGPFSESEWGIDSAIIWSPEKLALFFDDRSYELHASSFYDFYYLRLRVVVLSDARHDLVLHSVAGKCCIYKFREYNDAFVSVFGADEAHAFGISAYYSFEVFCIFLHGMEL